MYPPPHDPTYTMLSHGQPSSLRTYVSPANLAMHAYPYYGAGAPPLLPPQSPADGAGSTRGHWAQYTPQPISNAGDDEDNDEYDDKRRRNTAASARFRIKKKQRALELERSVSDLTSRASELEREASDLRR